jgi:SET domain-containing protein
MALLEKQLEVRESNIPGAGQGLFTIKPIAKGTRIVEYKGKVRTWKEVEFEDSNYYIFYVNENHVIDGGSNKKSIARYINDAKGITKVKGLTNNADFVVDGLKVFVEAKKDIPAGAEIFVGYGKEYWDVIRRNIKIEAKKE